MPLPAVLVCGNGGKRDPFDETVAPEKESGSRGGGGRKKKKKRVAGWDGGAKRGREGVRVEEREVWLQLKQASKEY